jgi:Fic family protein
LKAGEKMDETKLNRLLAEMNEYRPLDEKQVRELNRNVRIEHVWSSNAIEGSSLDQYETASILNNGITIHGESVKDVLAAIDLNQAYEYMMDLAVKKQKLTQSIIRDLNRLSLAKPHPEWGGIYRAISVRPKGLEAEPYLAPFEIPSSMQELVDCANSAAENMHPVKYAADLHFKFVAIHPFRDGNGRTARLLMNLSLTEAGYPVVNVFPDKKSRNEYMSALAESRRQNNPVSFENLIARYTERTLQKRIEILRLN